MAGDRALNSRLARKSRPPRVCSPLNDWLLVARAVGAVEWERGHPQKVADPLTDPERRRSVEQSRDKLVEALESLEPYLEERSAGGVPRPRRRADCDFGEVARAGLLHGAPVQPGRAIAEVRW